MGYSSPGLPTTVIPDILGCFGHRQPGLVSVHTPAAALTQPCGERTLHPMGHCRCCPPHAASAPGLNPGSKATILAQPASQLLFSSGCHVWCEQTVSEWGDFLQWSPVKTQTCCQARPCFGGFGSAWAGMVSPLWSSQPQDAASAECWCLPLPAQHSQPPPAAREQPDREIFFHFFFIFSSFFLELCTARA